MDLELRRATRRRLAPGDPEVALARTIRLARVGDLDPRDERLLSMLGLLGGRPERAWLEGALNSAFRSDAGLGGVRETDLKGPVLTACATVVRRTLRSWLREPKLHQELSAHLAEFEARGGGPLLPSRQELGRRTHAELGAFLERVQPAGRQRAGVLALRELFGAFSRSGRAHLRQALDYAEPFVSTRRVREAFALEFARHALGRARC